MYINFCNNIFRVTSIFLTTTRYRHYYYPHFTDEGAAQFMTCQRSPSRPAGGSLSASKNAIDEVPPIRSIGWASKWDPEGSWGPQSLSYPHLKWGWRMCSWGTWQAPTAHRGAPALSYKCLWLDATSQTTAGISLERGQ